MSVNNSATNLNLYFKEKHDAYKALISHIADLLSADDLRSIFWYIDASPKLRTGSALDVLEYLERAGYFSDRNVQNLSRLLKDIKRVDLMEKVNVFSQQYVRHYSLPAPTIPHNNIQSGSLRSYSLGSRLTSPTPFPQQETAADPSLEQVHPTLTAQPHAPASEFPHMAQRPANLMPTLSQEHVFTSHGENFASPQLEPAMWHASSWENQSLFNSGSILLNYNSFPSSHNASEEVFPKATCDQQEPFQHLKAGGTMQMPAEYYNIGPSPLYSTPTTQQNWYQHNNSSGNIPQEDPPPRTASFNLKSQHGHNSRRKSAADIFPSPEYLHHRLSQPQVFSYYTPPYNRKNPATNYRASPLHPPSISEHISDGDLCDQQLPTSSRQEEAERKSPELIAPHTSKEENNILHAKMVNLNAMNNGAKGQVTNREQVLPNSSSEGSCGTGRRRTSSLHRDSNHDAKSVKTSERRLSADDKHTIDSTPNQMAKGSMQSSSTLNSDDSRFSPTSTLSAKSNKHHRHKETFLSRLTQQFSKVARPHKEIEWQIKRSKLNKIIYEQADKFLTCPYKLELEGGPGVSNPKITLYVHPYGIEDDCNVNVTLEVGIEVPTRPRAQRPDSRAQVEVSVRAEDRDANVVLGESLVRESVRLKYFLIKGFIDHQELKSSHSEHIFLIISANLSNSITGAC